MLILLAEVVTAARRGIETQLSLRPGSCSREKSSTGSYVVRAKWSQWPGLNRRPTVYETVALPLSYIGTHARAGRALRREPPLSASSIVSRRNAALQVRLLQSTQ